MKDREVEAAGAKAEKLELAAAPKLGHAGADPKVLGKRFHSDWNLPSISPVFCALALEVREWRCKGGRVGSEFPEAAGPLGLWGVYAY